MSAAANLSPGQRLGPYLVEATAGRGGMGVVYRARDTRLGRPVALKVLGEASVGSEDALRFLREARTAAALSHPGIVVVHDAGAIDGIPYLVMEWVDGMRLDALVQAHHLDDRRRLEIVVAIAEILAFAHGKGVIHRDVKPSNVMLDSGGRVRLLDFGLAKVAGGSSVHVAGGTYPFETRTGSVLGTPAYMAPEQRIGGAPIDARVDQFAWGVLAYELLARVHPSGEVATGAGVFPAARPRPLSWIRPGIEETVASIIHRAMSFDPDVRFASMGEIVTALGGALRRLPPGTLPSRIASTTSERSPANPTNDRSVLQPTAGATAGAMLTTGGPVRSTGDPVLSTHGPRPLAPRLDRRYIVLALGGLLLALGIFVLALRDNDGVTIIERRAEEAPPEPPHARVVSGLTSLPFAGTSDEVSSKIHVVERRVDGCLDGQFPRKHAFMTVLTIAPDGRVERVEEQAVCMQGESSSVYACTGRGRPVRPKHPGAPESVFACIERALLASRLPPIDRPRYEEPKAVTQTIYFELE